MVKVDVNTIWMLLALLGNTSIVLVVRSSVYQHSESSMVKVDVKTIWLNVAGSFEQHMNSIIDPYSSSGRWFHELNREID